MIYLKIYENQVKNSFRGKAAKNPIKTRVGFLSHAVVQLSWDFYGIVVGELRKRSQVKLTATRLYLISGNMKCDLPSIWKGSFLV